MVWYGSGRVQYGGARRRRQDQRCVTASSSIGEVAISRSCPWYILSRGSRGSAGHERVGNSRKGGLEGRGEGGGGAKSPEPAKAMAQSHRSGADRQVIAAL